MEIANNILVNCIEELFIFKGIKVINNQDHILVSNNQTGEEFIFGPIPLYGNIYSDYAYDKLLEFILNNYDLTFNFKSEIPKKVLLIPGGVLLVMYVQSLFNNIEGLKQHVPDYREKFPFIKFEDI